MTGYLYINDIPSSPELGELAQAIHLRTLDSVFLADLQQKSHTVFDELMRSVDDNMEAARRLHEIWYYSRDELITLPDGQQRLAGTFATLITPESTTQYLPSDNVSLSDQWAVLKAIPFGKKTQTRDWVDAITMYVTYHSSPNAGLQFDFAEQTKWCGEFRGLWSEPRIATEFAQRVRLILSEWRDPTRWQDPAAAPVGGEWVSAEQLVDERLVSGKGQLSKLAIKYPAWKRPANDADRARLGNSRLRYVYDRMQVERYA